MIATLLVAMPLVGVVCRPAERPPAQHATPFAPTPTSSVLQRPPACDPNYLNACPSNAPYTPEDIIQHPLFGRIVRNQIIVTFRTPVNPVEATQLLLHLPVEIMSYDVDSNTYVVRVPDDSNDKLFRATIRDLNRDAHVEAAMTRSLVETF